MTAVETVVTLWTGYAALSALSLKLAIIWQPEASTRVGAAVGALAFFLLVSPALSVALRLDQHSGPSKRVAEWLLSPEVV